MRLKGEATWNVSQMARRNKAQKQINTTVRMTAFDAANSSAFTIASRPAKGPARAPTAAETHANNYAKATMFESLFAVHRWIPAMDADLAAMNRSKVGRPYEYSNLLIYWLMGVMASTGLDPRAVSGACMGIMSMLGRKGPSYTRLLERVNELADSLVDEVDQELVDRYDDDVLILQACENVSERIRRVGIDSSGFNLSNPNLWRKTKWGNGPVDKGWLKVHALCDVDSGEIIAFALTRESVGDAPLLRFLVETSKKKGHMFDTVYADGAYSSNENWIYLCRDNKYRFVTSFMTTTGPTSNGCLARGEAAKLWCSLPCDEWVKVSGYGTRWKCENVFSDIKRLFEETIEARSKRGQTREIYAKVDVFNRYKHTRAEMIGTTGNSIVIG